MLFSSQIFIFAFLPIFMIVYYIAGKKYRNAVLFIGSIIFYSIGELKYLPLMIGMLTVNYFAAELIEDSKSTIKKKIILFIILFVDFGILIYYKGFAKHIPLGISFYTFQITAYVIDVYKTDAKAQHNYVNLGTYLCMFPQLIAGPIILYTDIDKEIEKREYNFENIEEGLKIFVIGLASKVLVADVLAMLVNEIKVTGYDSITTIMAWIGAIAYSIEIYFDFNGYSLMAIGLGRMLGFHIPRNFDNPYISRSVSEFWRRWHITLGRWFRDYVYIPLGGNRKGRFNTIRNLLIVWILTGIWHGCGVTFVLWGISTFVIIALEKVFLHKILDKSKIISSIYMFLFINVSWVIFSLEDLTSVKTYLLRMCPVIKGSASAYINSLDYVSALKRYGLFLIIGIIFSTPIGEKLYKKYEKTYILAGILLVVFWLCVYRMATSAANPFLYFRF